MQGIESLNNFKKFVSSLGGLGRYEDTYIVHAAEGETVVPMEVLDRNPALKKRLFQSMIDMGIEPGRYIVGNELNSKNPVTGQPEFFLKKIVSQIRKALPGDTEKFLGPLVGLATGNPFLGALAGGIGAGTQGAIGGGLAGFQSPGIKGLGGEKFRGLFGGDTLFGKNKIDAVGFKDLLDRKGIGRFLFGEGDQSGLLGRFDFASKKDDVNKLSDVEKFMKIKEEAIAGGLTPEEAGPFAQGQLKDAKKAADAVLGGMSIMDAAKLFGLGTAGLGLLIQLTDEQQDVGLPVQELPEGQAIQSILNPIAVSPGMAKGGVMDLRQGGESEGPGTGTSDDIPAMLSDGEFVMTAKAVRGAGGGDRREGAKRMYQMMDNLEARA